MNSYLGLVSEYAKVHKKKNRLTVICIAIAVMLVTAIFGMADMSVKAQINAYIQRTGNFHANITGISDNIAAQIAGRSDIKVSGWLGFTEDPVYAGRELLVQGGGREIAEQMNLDLLEGEYPQSEREALLDKRGLEQFGLSIGDTIDVPFFDGQTRQYRITGLFGDFSALTANDNHGLFLTIDGIREIQSAEYGEYYYIQFNKGVNIRRALSEMKSEYGLSDEQVSENRILLGLMGQSDDSVMWGLYITAGVLFVLVTMAGVFMIAGSFNMSVLERTQFFGLLRCLGASKIQIKRYIRLEGLRYSLKGIPIGLLAGCMVMWVSALVLNAVDLGTILPEMQLFHISLPGIASGVLIGFLVVMIASKSPAKKAAQVSPQAAVTGNINQANYQKTGKAASGKLRIDTAMGIHHAFSNRKNMVLTAGSFALSIILLLSFTVLLDFMGYALNPLKPSAPDISVMGADSAVTVSRPVMEELRTLPGIKHIYGRMLSGIPATGNNQNEAITLVSYDAPQFDWIEGVLTDGRIADVENGGGILVDNKKAETMGLKIGDVISLSGGGKSFDVEVAGILSHVPFFTKSDNLVAVCSEPTFTKITGVEDYAVIDIQFTPDVREDIAVRVRNMIPEDIRLLDRRQSNRETIAAYYTMAVFVYGFLIVIALVAFINIANIVSASVSSRMNHYGVMRAVGMSGRQLRKVIITEAAAYAITGCVVGGASGILLNRLFFGLMITSNWSVAWQPPLAVLAVTVLAALLTTFISAVYPAKKLRAMSIVNVVNMS